MKKLSTEEFIKRAKETHGDKYDYSITNYINRRTKIKYICPVHGVQEQLPENHIKYGCGQCGISKASIKRRVPIENLIKRFNEVHNNKYDYSKMNYVNIDTPIEIICPEHGSFFQSPYEHQKGANCPRCVKHYKLKLCDINTNIEGKTFSSNTFIMSWPKDFDKKQYAINILNSLGDFPYDTYQEKELISDYSKISSSPNSLSGLKVIKNFHKNIYTSRVGGHITPVEAWNDKDLLLKTILNRMVYHKPPYTPKVIRDGLNISKKAPKVSVFKPSLARFLIENFLNEFDTVFDPFSGFSGRMLGCCSLGKKYIGQDISKEQVLYSNQIIDLLKLNATVIQKDIFESSGEYDCLFTCSPYNLKETWNDNETNLSCDEWIEVCLKNFKCKKYLFVVDKTENYKEHIVYEINNRSHLSSNTEKVILL